MRREIDFDCFGENQKIYFDIKRLQELEKKTGKTINQIMQTDLSISLIVSALHIGLQHEYGTKSDQFYNEKIGQYIESGGTIFSVFDKITRAIMSSGIMGQAMAKAAFENKSKNEIIAEVEKEQEKN